MTDTVYWGMFGIVLNVVIKVLSQHPVLETSIGAPSVDKII
jgi:hypothetical protein